MEYYKFQRGQVWYIQKNTGYVERTNEIKKDRPWIVLSVAEYNEANHIITAVPLTSRDIPRDATEVPVVSPGNMKGLALCAQIKSFSTYGDEYGFSYEFTVGESTLAALNKGVFALLGINQSASSNEKVIEPTRKIESPIYREVVDDECIEDRLTVTDAVEVQTKLDSHKRNYHRLSNDEIKNLLKESAAGASNVELAKKYKVSPSTVVNYKFNHTLYQ